MHMESAGNSLQNPILRIYYKGMSISKRKYVDIQRKDLLLCWN